MSVTTLSNYNAVNEQRMKLDQSSYWFPRWTFRIANFDIDQDSNWLVAQERWVWETDSSIAAFVLVAESSWNNGWCYVHHIDKKTKTITETSHFFSDAGNFIDAYQEWSTLHINYTTSTALQKHTDFNIDTKVFWAEQSWYDTGGTALNNNSVTWSDKTRTAEWDKESWWWYDYIIPFMKAID